MFSLVCAVIGCHVVGTMKLHTRLGLRAAASVALFVSGLGVSAVAMSKTFYVVNGGPQALSFQAVEDGVVSARRSSLVVPAFSTGALVVDDDSGGTWTTSFSEWNGSTWVLVNGAAAVSAGVGSDYELRYKCDSSLAVAYNLIPHPSVEVERVPASYWITLLSSGIAFGVFGGVVVVLMRLSRRSEEILRLS